MVRVTLLLSKAREAAALEFELTNFMDHLLSVSLLGDEGALGVGESENGSAELEDLEGGVLGNVARSRDGNEGALLVERVLRASLGNHLHGENVSTGDEMSRKKCDVRARRSR